MYKFIAYVPQSHLEVVKDALFEAGAGQLGGYSHCAWQILGTGQFKPLQGANPTIGEVDEIKHVPEWRVEMIVPEEALSAVVQAYRLAHPYEVPAFDVYEMVDVG